MRLPTHIALALVWHCSLTIRGSGLGLLLSGSGLDAGDLDLDLDTNGDLDLGLVGESDFIGDFDLELGRGSGDRVRGGVGGRSCLICICGPVGGR